MEKRKSSDDELAHSTKRATSEQRLTTHPGAGKVRGGWDKRAATRVHAIVKKMEVATGVNPACRAVWAACCGTTGANDHRYQRPHIGFIPTANGGPNVFRYTVCRAASRVRATLLILWRRGVINIIPDLCTYIACLCVDPATVSIPACLWFPDNHKRIISIRYGYGRGRGSVVWSGVLVYTLNFVFYSLPTPTISGLGTTAQNMWSLCARWVFVDKGAHTMRVHTLIPNLSAGDDGLGASHLVGMHPMESDILVGSGTSTPLLCVCIH